MRLTTRTNLAMRVLMYCALNRDRVVRTTDIARRCNASQNHLGQVINELAHLGFVQTVRGRGGGIRLLMDPAEIPVGKIIRDFEHETRLADCFRGDASDCPIIPFCRLKGMLAEAIEAFFAVLDRATIQDLVEGNQGLELLFSGTGTEDGRAISPGTP